MSARQRLLWNVMLPVDDDIIAGETDAFDAQLERQLTRVEGMSLSDIAGQDLDDWRDGDDDDTDSLPRGGRYS